MVVVLLAFSFLLAVVTGFAVSSNGAFWYGFLGQVVHGLLSITCFAMIIAAFWIYGWKTGIVDIVVVFVGANLGLSLFRRLMKKFEDT
jgi:hypothetical protein